MEFEEFLIQILNHYDSSWQEDPLDGDEVDTLVEHLRNQLNLINGNITRAEYERSENMDTKYFNKDNLSYDKIDILITCIQMYRDECLKVNGRDHDCFTIKFLNELLDELREV